jgi:hypothetical protein
VDPEGGAYRFVELGWLQFERLADALVAHGAPGEAPEWDGRADEGRIGILDADLALPGMPRLPGPVLVAVAWADGELGARLLERAAAVAAEMVTPPRSAVLIAGDGAADSWRDHGMALPGEHHLVLGPAELTMLLDASPTLRRDVPAVLGVRDLEALVDPAVMARSTAEVGAAYRLARVFVATGAYRRALAALDAAGFAVITGPPEMGKTAIARAIALTRLCEGWEAHECTNPAELWAHHDPSRPQVFVADDAFGSTEYRPDAAEGWARELEGILRATDERHWLIWTSRPAPLKAALARLHRERGGERFPRPGEVHVDAAELGVEERASILFRHARLHPLTARGVDVVRAHGGALLDHSHFTPERIRRFVRHRLPELESGDAPFGRVEIAEAIAREIREPTEAMRASLLALPAEYRELLVAMLDAPPTAIHERELAAAARRHLDHGLEHAPWDLVDRLTDHFLRLIPPHSVTWVHPSWRDLVIDHVAADAAERARFLERASLEGLLLAISDGGGAAGERRFPLLVSDADWDAVARCAAELVPELEDTGLMRLLSGLESAVQAEADERTRREATALAESVLELARARVDKRPRPVSLALLESWYALAEAIGGAAPRLNVAATWIELLPTGSLDLGSPEELLRTEDWLRLLAILEVHDPSVLAYLGTPEGTHGVLERLAEAARGLTPEARATPVGAAQTACAMRLARTRLGAGLRSVAQLEAQEITAWFAASLDDDEELAEELGPMAGEPGRRFVARVLSDLRPTV